MYGSSGLYGASHLNFGLRGVQEGSPEFVSADGSAGGNAGPAQQGGDESHGPYDMAMGHLWGVQALGHKELPQEEKRKGV